MRLPRAAALAVLVMFASLASSAADVDVRLIEAVKSGNATAVQTLSRQRALVSAAEADGSTALHWAARLDRIRSRADAHSRRRAGQHQEPLCRHAADSGRRQRQRGRRRCAVDGRRGRKHRGRRWRDGVDARGTDGQAGAGAGAARSWSGRQGARSVAWRNRADVGGRGKSRRGGLAARCPWRRSQRALDSAGVPQGQGRCRDDGVHGAAAWRIDRPDACGSTRRS